MIYPINWNDDAAIRACFSYQTRFLGAPRVFDLPPGMYQKDQVDMHDNIVDGAKHLGAQRAEGQIEVIFTDRSLWAKIPGGRIRLGSGRDFQRWRD